MTFRDRNASIYGKKLSGGKCIICGWHSTDLKGNSLIVGAHVKELSGNKESDTFDNIICLCPNHHAEFDAGKFYIDKDNECAIFFDENNEFHQKKLQGSIKHIKPEYLIYRKYKFIEKIKLCMSY